MDRQNAFHKLPYTLIMLIALICTIGFFVLYSAAGGNMTPWCLRQVINFLVLFPISIMIAMIDIRIIYKLSFAFYLFILIMLIGVELFGSVAMGGQRWINLGLIKIQPSEPAKIAVVLMLAKYFHNVSHNDINKIHKLIIPIIAILIPCALIIKQPDLGTGMVVLIVSTIMLFALGVSIWKFITVGAAAIISLPIIWQMMYDYQKRRILMFWDPSQDPLGSGYNIIQSKIAIGSGGMLGKGLTQGTQSQLEFLPEHQTDFIFATMAEELGFIGGMVLVTLYAMVIILSLLIAINSKSLFGKLIAIGITSIFFSHIFINMGMVMGLLPVVGVPLPLISYGGTMMSSMLVGLGLIMNVEVNRNQAI